MGGPDCLQIKSEPLVGDYILKGTWLAGLLSIVSVSAYADISTGATEYMKLQLTARTSTTPTQYAISWRSNLLVNWTCSNGGTYSGYPNYWVVKAVSNAGVESVSVVYEPKLELGTASNDMYSYSVAEFYTNKSCGRAEAIVVDYDRNGVFDLTQQGVTVSAGKTALYRYVRPSNGAHVYTAAWSELGAGNSTYSYEGVVGYVYTAQNTGAVPFYRYFSPANDDHFYTANWSELGGGALGYNYEGSVGNVHPTRQSDDVPLYRYSNGRQHFYTTDFNELGNGAKGYTLENIAGYISNTP